MSGSTEPVVPDPRDASASPGHHLAGLLTAINVVLAGVAGVYATTRSVTVTCIATGAALTIVWIMASGRWPDETRGPRKNLGR